jgi:hypothetical protein
LATLRLTDIKPRSQISEKSTPKPLREALLHIFQESSEGVWLVGGTALAGYYAEHRQSDDLDLFAVDSIAHKAALLAVRTLKRKGASLVNERTTPSFYHSDVEFKGHSFTVDVVLGENLHRIGKAFRTKDGVNVIDLQTLFATKIATLISRCSEKDLYDLDWIFSKVGEIDIQKIINWGAQIDAGLNVETLLIGLQGAILRKEACHFLLPKSKVTVEQAFQKIVNLQKKLIQRLIKYEASLAPSKQIKALSQAVKDQKKFT